MVTRESAKLLLRGFNSRPGLMTEKELARKKSNEKFKAWSKNIDRQLLLCKKQHEKNMQILNEINSKYIGKLAPKELQ